jgi:hypothetical protein
MLLPADGVARECELDGSGRALRLGDSQAPTPEALMRAITVKVVSHTPAESLKPERTSPPRVRAKLPSIVLALRLVLWQPR